MPRNRELKRQIEELRHTIDNMIIAFTHQEQRMRKLRQEFEDEKESTEKLIRLLGEAVKKILEEK